MKNVFKMSSVFLCAAVVMLSGCKMADVGPGEQAVVTVQPAFFGHGGIDPIPVQPGTEWLAPTTSYTIVNMKPQMFEIDYPNMMSKDGVPMEVDATIGLQVTDSVRLMRDFGVDWYAINIQKEFVNQTKQNIRLYEMNEIGISTTKIVDAQNDITAALAKYIESKNLPVKIASPVLLGKVVAPEQVLHQRIDTATQEQRIKTEAQRKLAEDARADAENSKAVADNAYRNKMGFNQDQYIQLESLKAQQNICANAKCTYIMNGSKSSPIIDAR